MADGATELDMVINIGQAIGGEWDAVASDIAAVTKAAHDGGAIVKVIFENCYLNDDQKVRLCQICGEVGADYVKTSTGYGTGGATLDDLRLMRRAAPPHVKLKAAGGVRTLDAMIEAAELGCDRIGASRTAEILDELKSRLGALSFQRMPIRARQCGRRPSRSGSVSARFSNRSTPPSVPTINVSQRSRKGRFRARRRCTGAGDRGPRGRRSAANRQSTIWLPPSVR